MNKQNFKFWWTYTIKGVFAIAFGLIALFVPNASDGWLVQLFGGFIALSGVSLICGSVLNYMRHKKWGLWFVEGLLDLVLGVLIIVYHQSRLNIELFIIFVATWAVTVGFAQLIAALKANNGVKTKWLLFLNSLIVIGGGFVLFYNPFESNAQLMNSLGIFAVIFGSFITVYSFGLKES